MAKDGRLKEAIDLASRAVDLRTNDPQLYFLKAKLLFKAKHGQEAKETVLRAISLEPEMGGYHELLSKIEVSLGNISAAIKAAERSIELSSEDEKPVAVQRLAVLRAKRMRQQLSTIVGPILRTLKIRW
jgi:predicted Zn-dependent protease